MVTEPLHVSVDLTNEKVQFSGVARDNPAIICDYGPPLGDGQGYTGLELLLVSLAACSGTSVVMLLRKMKRQIAGFKVEARGIRRTQHPTAFEQIFLDFVVDSPDCEESDIEKAIQLSEETLCPVWAMLKNNVEVIATCRLTVTGGMPEIA